MHCAFLVGGDCDSVCAGKTTIVPEPVMNLITPDVGRRGGVHWPTEVGDIAEAAPQTHPHHHGTRVSHAHPLLAYCGFGSRVHSHVLAVLCVSMQPTRSSVPRNYTEIAGPQRRPSEGLVHV